MRAKTMAAIPAGTRLARVAAIMLSVVALVATVLVAFPRQAEAATQQAYASGTLTKVQDGTGWDTEGAQSFVNAKNGFEVGDNAKDDGVVSSRDRVQYDFSLSFSAAAARKIRIWWDTTDAPYLDGSTTDCVKVPLLDDVTEIPNGCEFSLPAGRTGSLTYNFLLLAKDTLGTVKTGQRPVLRMARVDNAGNIVSDIAEYKPSAITVVSAPAGDLVAQDYDLGTSGGRLERHSKMSETADTTGYIDLRVAALAYPHYSDHGASTGGPWSATLDVTAMPPSSTYTLIDADGTCGTTQGKPLEASEKAGKRTLRVENASGDRRLCWSIPKEELQKENGAYYVIPGTTRGFDIQVIPDQGFLTPPGDNALLNMGTGSEPGLGKERTFSTQDNSILAEAGFPYPNNDWTRAVIDRAPVGAGAFGKKIRLPYTQGKTIFAPENKDFSKASSTKMVSASTLAEDRTIAAGTDEEPLPFIYTKAIPDPEARSTLIMQDMWRKGEHVYLGGVSLTYGTAVGGDDEVTIPAKDYQVLYTTQVLPGDKSTPWIAGTRDERLAYKWSTDMPEDTTTITGVRIVANIDAMRADSRVEFGETAGEKYLFLHVKTKSTGTVIDDASHATYDWSDMLVDQPTKQDIPGSGSAYVIVNANENPGDAVTFDTSKTKYTAPDQTEHKGAASPGDTVALTLVPTVNSVQVDGIPMKPTMTVSLPANLINPKPADDTWKLVKVVDTEAGGRQAIFELNAPDGKITPAISAIGEATLPALNFTSQVSVKSTNADLPVHGTLDVTVDAHDDVEAYKIPTSSTDTTVQVATQGIAAAYIETLTPRVEINDEIGYHFSINAAGTSYGPSKSATTVIKFPVSDADAVRRGKNDGGLDGKWGDYALGNSHYDGGYTLSGPVTLDTSNATPTTILYSKTTHMFSDDEQDYRWYTWDEIKDDPSGVTAIKVVSDFETVVPDNKQPYKVAASDGEIHLTPSKNTAGNQYNMWIGAVHFDNEEDKSAGVPEKGNIPWPAVAKTVASTISGTVWWDNNKDTAVGSDTKAEPRIGNVLMSLQRWNSETNAYEPALDNDGKPITTLTDSSGYYEFTNLHSGQYKVTIARTKKEETGGEDHAVQQTTTSYYNEHLKVGTTRSYKAVLDNARDDSGDITLGVDTTVPKVNFGYVPQDPKVTLDKSQNYMTCNSQNCTVSWDVKVTNTGNTTIKPQEAALTDRMSSAVTIDPADPNAITTGLNGSGQPTYAFFTKVALASNSGFAIDKDGHLWAWGRDAQCRLGLDTPNGNCRGNTDYRPSVLPTRLTVKDGGKEVTFKDVTALTNGGIAIDTDNHVWGWGSNNIKPSYNGRNDQGQSGILPGVGVPGSLAVPTRLTEVEAQLKDGESLTKVSGSRDTVGILTSRGRVIAWGNNAYGQIKKKGTDYAYVAPMIVQGWQGPVQPTFDGNKNRAADLIVTGLNIIILDDQGRIWVQGDRRAGLTQNRDAKSDNCTNAVGFYTNGCKSSFVTLRDSDDNVVQATSIAALDIALVYVNAADHSLYGLGYSATLGNAGPLWNKDALFSTSATDGMSAADNAKMVFYTEKPIKLQAPARDPKTGNSANLLQGFTISQIAAGGGGVMVFGKDVNATERIIQLGTTTSSLRNGTSTVTLPAGESASQMVLNAATSADGNYSKSVAAVLTERGHLYSWGWTGFAVTGTGLLGTESNPASIGTPTDVTPVIPPDPDPTGISLMCADDDRINDGANCKVDATKGYQEAADSPSTGTTTRMLPLKYTLEPGQSVYYHFTGTVARDQANVTKVTNQAIFTSPNTPYYTPDADPTKALGVPAARVEAAKASSANAYLPTLPNANNIVESTHDVTGTNACVTGTDVGTDKEHSFDLHIEDSCDQVGAVIPPLPSVQLGSISGLYWMDADGDGKQSEADAVPTGNGEEKAVKHFAGQKVELVSGGNVIATTTTDENGAYSFTNLPLGQNYTVRFSRVTAHRFTRSDVGDEQSKATDGSLVDSDVDTSSTAEMLPSSATTIKLDANTPNRVHIDAGVLLPSAQAMPHTGANTLMILAGLAFLGLLSAAWILSGRKAPKLQSLAGLTHRRA